MPDLDDLLTKTSRTFALSIPLLPEPTRTEVRLAYLLFRIADTFEDSTLWSPGRRVEALADFRQLLAAPDAAKARQLGSAWTAEPPCEHAGYVELLAAMPEVLAAFVALAPAAREQVRLHTDRTAEGMAGYVRKGQAGGRLALASVEELRAYCYVVAGIVGEMLTELFVLAGVAAEEAAYLRARARAFGEGLQLVNILKDAGDDAAEGRTYLPAELPRATVFELARQDLETASDYTHALQRGGADSGIVAFCALPVLLAWGTLERVEAEGPGAKLSRLEVFAVTRQLDSALEKGLPVIPDSIRAARGSRPSA